MPMVKDKRCSIEIITEKMRKINKHGEVPLMAKKRLERIANYDNSEVISFGQLKPGDKLFDEHGEPVEISGVHKKHIPQRMFLLEDNDGNSIKVSGTHLWYVVTQADIDNHQTRISYAREHLAPLLENTIVYNRLVSIAEGYFREGAMLEMSALDAAALLFDDNHIDVSSPAVADVYFCVERIAQSAGLTAEQTTVFQDMAYTAQEESFVEGFYDARVIAQQVLSIAGGRAWHKKYPVRVGRVVTTIDMLKMIEHGESVYIPD